LVVRVAAVDDQVAARELRPEILNGKLGDVTCGHHQPDDAWRVQPPREPDDRRGGFEHSVRGQRLRSRGIGVEAYDLDAGASKPARHVAAHAPQTNDTDLHSGGVWRGEGRMLP